MMLLRFVCGVALLAANEAGSAGELARAYADKAGNVHVVTAAGKDLKLTSDQRADDVRLSPDGAAAAWLTLSHFAADGRKWPSELHVHYRGRTRSIKCAGIIREYWFWKDGTHVATDCGGLHFAGIETLYEVRTMQEVERFDQAQVATGKRPDWSASQGE